MLYEARFSKLHSNFNWNPEIFFDLVVNFFRREVLYYNTYYNINLYIYIYTTYFPCSYYTNPHILWVLYIIDLLQYIWNNIQLGTGSCTLSLRWKLPDNILSRIPAGIVPHVYDRSDRTRHGSVYDRSDPTRHGSASMFGNPISWISI